MKPFLRLDGEGPGLFIPKSNLLVAAPLIVAGLLFSFLPILAAIGVLLGMLGGIMLTIQYDVGYRAKFEEAKHRILKENAELRAVAPSMTPSAPGAKLTSAGKASKSPAVASQRIVTHPQTLEPEEAPTPPKKGKKVKR